MISLSPGAHAAVTCALRIEPDGVGALARARIVTNSFRRGHALAGYELVDLRSGERSGRDRRRTSAR